MSVLYALSHMLIYLCVCVSFSARCLFTHRNQFSLVIWLSNLFLLSGFWFFHCHIEFHADIGMGLILQVGSAADMPKTPKNFPKCGNWKFDGFVEESEDIPLTCGTERNTAALVVIVCLVLFSKFYQVVLSE